MVDYLLDTFLLKFWEITVQDLITFYQPEVHRDILEVYRFIPS